MREPDRPRGAWRPWTESPMIAEALRDRPPEDIAVVVCDGCGSVAYYNQGSHCTCEHCDRGLDHLIGDDGEVISLADHLDAIAAEGGPPP